MPTMQPPATRAFGFNVIGYASGNLGLGVAARSLIDLIIEKGFAISIYDLDPGVGRAGHEQRFQKFIVEAIEDLPFAVNLFVLPPPTLTLLLRKYDKVFCRGDYMNVAVSFWELPVLPTKCIPTLDAMDAIVALSESMRCTFQFTLSGPLIIGGLLPLQLPQGIKRDRERFGLSDDAVIFVTSFETNSDPQRKNPLAVVDAFLNGVGDDPRAHLVIKVNNPKTQSGEHSVLRAILLRCAGHPRIRILTDTLPYADVLSLYATCDVYVSMHRAEGLGLGPMEAMALGKPVIATAWSGNTTFMNHTNSCLVSYRLVPVMGSIAEYSRLGDGVYWAEPNVSEAAAWMQQLMGDPILRARLGTQAGDDMARFEAEAKGGRLLKELQVIWGSRSFLPARVEQTAKPRQLQELVADRDRRIRQLESELSWIRSKLIYRIARAAKHFLTRYLGPHARG
jgi:glycosyltransferase involved in cell wall biosynthesis